MYLSNILLDTKIRLFISKAFHIAGLHGDEREIYCMNGSISISKMLTLHLISF